MANKDIAHEVVAAADEMKNLISGDINNHDETRRLLNEFFAEYPQLTPEGFSIDSGYEVQIIRQNTTVSNDVTGKQIYVIDGDNIEFRRTNADAETIVIDLSSQGNNEIITTSHPSSGGNVNDRFNIVFSNFTSIDSASRSGAFIGNIDSTDSTQVNIVAGAELPAVAVVTGGSTDATNSSDMASINMINGGNLANTNRTLIYTGAEVGHSLFIKGDKEFANMDAAIFADIEFETNVEDAQQQIAGAVVASPFEERLYDDILGTQLRTQLETGNHTVYAAGNGFASALLKIRAGADRVAEQVNLGNDGIVTGGDFIHLSDITRPNLANVDGVTLTNETKDEIIAGTGDNQRVVLDNVNNVSTINQGRVQTQVEGDEIYKTNTTVEFTGGSVGNRIVVGYKDDVTAFNGMLEILGANFPDNKIEFNIEQNGETDSSLTENLFYQAPLTQVSNLSDINLGDIFAITQDTNNGGLFSNGDNIIASQDINNGDYVLLLQRFTAEYLNISDNNSPQSPIAGIRIPPQEEDIPDLDSFVNIIGDQGFVNQNIFTNEGANYEKVDISVTFTPPAITGITSGDAVSAINLGSVDDAFSVSLDDDISTQEVKPNDITITDIIEGANIPKGFDYYIKGNDIMLNYDGTAFENSELQNVTDILVEYEVTSENGVYADIVTPTPIADVTPNETYLPFIRR